MANQAPNKAQERLTQVADHMSGGTGSSSGKKGKAALLEKNPDDVVVTCALRTPFTKGGKGGFKDTQSADLLLGAFKALIERSKIDPNSSKTSLSARSSHPAVELPSSARLLLPPVSPSHRL